MGQLIFRYGAMGSSKTANALMVRYNYLERGRKVALIKPSLDHRDGEYLLQSRIGLSASCELAEEFLKRPLKELQAYDAVLVDEAQFLSAEQVEKLAALADDADLSVICYGLRTDFQSHLFEGSHRLFELADTIEKLPTVCWCGKEAHYNARFRDGQIVRDGEQVLLGGNDTYVTLCRKHFRSGRIGPETETKKKE